MTDLESKVFKEYCKHDFDWLTAHIPLPSTLIKKQFNLSVHQCRTVMESLQTTGYLKSATLSYWDDEGHHMFRGYELTDKGRSTDVYKVMEDEEDKLLRKLTANQKED
jgi:hypothetical protein